MDDEIKEALCEFSSQYQEHKTKEVCFPDIYEMSQLETIFAAEDEDDKIEVNKEMQLVNHFSYDCECDDSESIFFFCSILS